MRGWEAAPEKLLLVFRCKVFCAPELWLSCVLGLSQPPCVTCFSSLLNRNLPMVMKQHADREIFLLWSFISWQDSAHRPWEAVWRRQAVGAALPHIPQHMQFVLPHFSPRLGRTSKSPLWLKSLPSSLGDRNPNTAALWIKKLISSIDKQLIVSGQYQQDNTRHIFYKVLE